MSKEWYEELRELYRPQQLRVLLIAESPPHPGTGTRRFFYAPDLTYDNLYRGVIEAIYGRTQGFDVSRKTDNLKRLQKDGYWLIDAVNFPVNRLPPPERRHALRQAVPQLVEKCQILSPQQGAVICHDLAFRIAAKELIRAGIKLLNGSSLPFPLPPCRERFITGLRSVLGIV